MSARSAQREASPASPARRPAAAQQIVLQRQAQLHEIDRVQRAARRTWDRIVGLQNRLLRQLADAPRRDTASRPLQLALVRRTGEAQRACLLRFTTDARWGGPLAAASRSAKGCARFASRLMLVRQAWGERQIAKAVGGPARRAAAAPAAGH